MSEEPGAKLANDRLDQLVDRVKKLEELVVLLSREKCNARPFQWLNHRVGQIERRIDRLNLDDWEGDLNC